MFKQITAAMTVIGSLGIFGDLGSLKAQEESAQPTSAPVQIKKEVKGKKAVPARGNEEDNRGDVAVAVTLSLPAGNPMLTVGQKKVEKKVAIKAAGEADNKTAPKEPEAKNSAMFGLGYSSTVGVQLHMEVQKDDIRRFCQMNLPNLFFCIPAALRAKEGAEEKIPMGINEARFPVKFIQDKEFIKTPDERIDLTGTEFLGLVDVADNPLRR